MSYQENIARLAERFPFYEDNLKYLEACGEYYRYAVIHHRDNEHDDYYLTLNETQADALDYSGMTVRDPDNKWTPVFLVDLHDLASFELSIEVRIGISAVNEIGFEPT